MNIIETGAAFLEGLALIASPCILPVLPLVLGASATGGRKRPFGVIIGFVLAFTLFALLARKIILATGIDPAVIKEVSLALLLLFGVVLISETLSRKFSELTGSAANLGHTLSACGKEDLLSGIFIGALIGLIWTPCAGPILAAVLVQIIRQENDLSGIIILSAFALGAGTPMLIIALMGRKITGRLGFFTRHAQYLRKIFGVLILVSVGLIASGIDTGSLLPSHQTATTKTHSGLEDALPAPYPAPEIIGIESWLNSQPLSLQNLKGKVVLIDFWTYSCINCVRTLPVLTLWDKKYASDGLVIIGIHSPEFEFEKNPENVKTAIEKHGIHYPVALDNHLATWSNFSNQYWPAHYLIDRQGNVVYTHFGEGKYDVTEHNIRTLLGLKDEVTDVKEKPVYSPGQTPETYLGFARTENFAGENLVHDTPFDYRLPPSLPLHSWALHGKWNAGAENITAEAAGAKLQLHFTARKVFLVLGNRGNSPIHAAITLNSQPSGTLNVTSHSLYEIISQDSAKEGALEITSDKAGLEAYAFTFGE